MNEPEEPDDQSNPFAGTPMEEFFRSFTGGSMPDMQQMMAQLQQMFTPHEGSVNFDMAKDVARHVLASAGDDPSVSNSQAGAVRDAARLAESWLDDVTDIDSGATTVSAWSRADWIEQTAPTWQRIIEPVAAHVVEAMGQAMPDEIKSMAGPLMGMLNQAGGAMFGQQVGQAIGGLAQEVVSSTDIGLPLGPPQVAAIVPAGVEAFGAGLEHNSSDVMLYLTLRECAHHRLFTHAQWLRGQLITAIEDFGRGVTIDTDRIESQLREIDPSRPEDLQQALSGGLFEPDRTASQEQALVRLETMLALIEGWVDDVVAQATHSRMEAAGSLAEAMRRRRAAGGPAEQTFASLVGLELRPRRLRDAANLWAAVRDRQGVEARDAVWSHPDLMPTAEDLDDPIGFAQSAASSTDEIDSALNELLDNRDDDA